MHLVVQITGHVGDAIGFADAAGIDIQLQPAPGVGSVGRIPRRPGRWVLIGMNDQFFLERTGPLIIPRDAHEPVVDQQCILALQGRAHWGGALSGRDIEAVNKTISGLLKLLFPDADMPIPDEELEAVVRIALESRRRVKEQQKRCLKTEFRNTHFSYFMGVDGVEQFVSTPELHSDEAIEADPLPPGQVWAINPGGQDSAPSLYRIEATCGPGSGVKILNAPVPPAFRESVRYGEQNLYSQSKELVGDRDPRNHEFSVQLRAMDTDRSGHGLGLPVLLSLCGSLIERSTKGGLIVVGALNLGGSVEIIPNPVAVAELAVEKGADQLLIPISARRQLLDLPDELATKVNTVFYADPADALMKAILE